VTVAEMSEPEGERERVPRMLVKARKALEFHQNNKPAHERELAQRFMAGEPFADPERDLPLVIAGLKRMVGELEWAAVQDITRPACALRGDWQNASGADGMKEAYSKAFHIVMASGREYFVSAEDGTRCMHAMMRTLDTALAFRVQVGPNRSLFIAVGQIETLEACSTGAEREPALARTGRERTPRALNSQASSPAARWPRWGCGSPPARGVRRCRAPFSGSS